MAETQVSTTTTTTDVTAETVMKMLGLIPHPEGGFFLETFRSGSVPMSTQGQTDLNVPDDDLVLTNRTDRRPDHDGRRNALTSIYWMPTGTSPKLHLTINISDHVHYYHGGDPFEYILFDPQTKKARRVVLGGNILAGHKCQIPVKGGLWKCGRLLVPDSKDTKDHKEPYCLLGEAFAPGFDFHDFTWVTPKMINKETVPKRKLRKLLKSYLHDRHADDSSDDDLDDNVNLTEEWTSYYD